MLRWTAWLFLLVVVASPVSSRAEHEPAPGACAASDAFTTPEEPLDRVAAAIAAGGPVNILAVGSATTVGDQLGADRNSAFPFRMVEALHAALPKVPFALTLRGGKGMTAEDMLPLLQAALTAKHYQLVLWQTGTVEAVRGVRPDGMVAALQEGIEHARDAGADVVLIDPQFSRFLRANADLDPYQAALQQVSAMPDVGTVPPFRRHARLGRGRDDRPGACPAGRSGADDGAAEHLPRRNAGPLRAERRRGAGALKRRVPAPLRRHTPAAP